MIMHRTLKQTPKLLLVALAAGSLLPSPALAITQLGQDFLPFNTTWQAPSIFTKAKVRASRVQATLGMTSGPTKSSLERAAKIAENAKADQAAAEKKAAERAARDRDADSQAANTPTPRASNTPRPTPTATPIAQTSQCVTDYTARSEANDYLAAADRQFRGNATWNTPKTLIESLKRADDAQRFGTGGVLRDIYTSGADVQTKQSATERHLQELIPDIEQQVRTSAESKAVDLSNRLDTQLNKPLTQLAGNVADVSTSRNPYELYSTNVVTSSYDLRRRGSFGFNFVTVARVDLRFRHKTSVRHTGLTYNGSYSTCSENPNPGQYTYETNVELVPRIEVEYSVTGRGDNRDSYSGTIIIADPNSAGIIYPVTGGQQL